MSNGLSSRYHLVRLLSHNDLSESWEASNTITGSQCFVKILRDHAKMGGQSAHKVLAESCALQRRLASSLVLRAIDRWVDGDKLFIEYRWLDHSCWQALSSTVLWGNIDSLLPRMCQAVDYLHLLRLVHNDLKISNFQVNVRDGDPRVILTDLDFLTEAGVSPQARILGTPAHIAPEIITNSRVLPQSDNYSMGVSLGLALKEIDSRDQSGDLKTGLSDGQLETFIKGLCNPDPYRRPRFLTDHLHRSGLITDATFEKMQRELLGMMLLSRLSGKWRRILRNPARLEVFLHQTCRVFGLHRDLIECISHGFARHTRSTFRFLKKFLENISLERHGDIWLLSPADSSIESLYDALGAFTALDSKQPSDESGTQSLFHQAIQDSIRYRDSGKIELAYFGVRKILRLTETNLSRLSGNDKAEALLLAGQLALGLNRQQDADTYYSRVAALTDISEEHGLKALYELFAIALARGDKERALCIMERGKHIAETKDQLWYQFAFRRYEAWLKIFDNSFDEADALFADLVRDSLEQGVHYIAVISLYSRAIPYWWKGDLSTAKDLLLEAVALARERELLSQAIPVVSLLAQLCISRGEYLEAVRHCRLAIQTTPHIEGRPALSMVDASLVQAHNRLCNFRKADYWLEHFLARGWTEQPSHHLLVYYQFKASISISRSDLLSAGASISLGLECGRLTTNSRTVGGLYHNLAEMYLYTGAIEDCLSAVFKGQEVFRASTEVALSLELELISILARHYYASEVHWTNIIDITRQLVDRGCRFYAAHGIIHALCCSNPTVREEAVALGLLMDLRENDLPVPVFSAVKRLVQLYVGKDTTLEIQIQGWKDALMTIHRSENRFLELIVLLQLAQLYLLNHMGRHAAKFFRQASQLAQSLDNQRLAEHAMDGLIRAETLTAGRSDLIASFHSLTQLLRSTESYHNALHQMLQFAVSQSGAERGVLLFPTGGTRGFRSIVSVNCDDQSVSDIVDFSFSIPRLVAHGIEPLIIANALEDHRTCKYRSVAIHNIMSVVVVPIRDGNDFMGVLYLDHHTIPALFSKDDLHYILAIADLLSVVLTTSQELRSLRSSVRELEKQLGSLGTFITRDQNLLRLFEHLPQFAKTNVSMLIQGESGTGKEVLCHEIHRMSLRAGKPLIMLNCAAIATNMIEAELFGVAKHAATGVSEKEGKFSVADGGTLFLDEIGDMPLDTQAKVLRALEYQEFEKVGSNRVIRTDIRFIYATNKDLARLVEEGTFRRDLFFRINTVVIKIPPLREHLDDVPYLLEHFVRVFDKSLRPLRFSGESIAMLSAYHWPGNIRELRNLVERLCIVHPGMQVTPAMLPPELVGEARRPTARKLKEGSEIRMYRDAFYQAGGNQSEISRILNVPLSTVRRKLQKYGIRRVN